MAALGTGTVQCVGDRGYEGTDNLGAGHIRWGKAIKGLTGKLGEFTARHVGPAPRRGHLIRIEAEDGAPAVGYATSNGDRLAPEIIVSNKTNIRREMAAALRAFGGATRLMNGAHWIVNVSNTSQSFDHLIDAEAHLWSVFASMETR